MNFLKIEWEKFINGLEELLASKVYYGKHVKISYEFVNKELFENDMVDIPKLIKDKKSYRKNLEVNICVEDLSNKGKVTKIPKNILTIPCFVENGIIDDGNIYEFVSTYRKYSGYYIKRKEDKKQQKNENGLLQKVKDETVSLELNTVAGSVFSVKESKHCLFLQYENPYNKSKTEPILLGTFLKAIMKKSDMEILSEIGDFPILKRSLDTKHTIEECISIVASMMGMKGESNVEEKSYYVQSQLRYIKTKMDNNTRYNIVMRYSSRLSGKVLAEDLVLEGKVYSKGLSLNGTILSEIDEVPDIECIYVKEPQSNRTVKVIKKLDGNFDDEFATAINWFILSYKYNFNYEQGDNETYNLAIDSLSTVFNGLIDNFLSTLSRKIDEETNNKKVDAVGAVNAALKDMNKSNGAYSNGQDKIIKYLKNSNFFQQSDDTNIVYSIAKSAKITDSVPKTSETKSKRDRGVSPSEYGRVCPIESPESDKIGINKTLTYLSKIDSAGRLLTPYIDLDTGEVVYISAIEEKNKIIAAWDADLTQKTIDARIEGEIKRVPSSKAKYKEISPAQVVSYSVLLTPFVENDNAKRVLMSANQIKQAVGLINGEAPITRTGFESPDEELLTARDIIEEARNLDPTIVTDGIKLINLITSPEERMAVFQFDDGKVYEKYMHSNTKTMGETLKRWLINLQEYWTGDDIVIYNSNLDIRKHNITKPFLGYSKYHELDREKLSTRCNALGRNLRVGFMMYYGYGYEDAIIINKDLVEREDLDCIMCKTIEVELKKSDKYSEQFSNRIVNSQKTIPYLNLDGLPEKGTKLKSGMVAVGKLKTYKEDGGRIVNSSYKVKPTEEGIVINSYLSSDKTVAYIILGKILAPSVGDKMAGRHGNKGVIAKVVPREDMPFSEDGQVLDVILTPLGIPSRMNLGQLLESILGWCGDKLGEVEIVEPFNTNNNRELLTQKIAEAGYKEVYVYDGKSGRKLERPMSVVIMYMHRLHHIASRKVAGISLSGNNVDPITLQPKKGKSEEGGQRFGEMENWGLSAYNVPNLMQDMMSIQSDDYIGKEELKRAILDNPNKIQVKGKNNNIDFIKALFRALGTDLISNSSGYKMIMLTDEAMSNIATEEVDIYRTDCLHPAMEDTRDFKNNRRNYRSIPLKCKMVNPFTIELLDNLFVVTKRDANAIITPGNPTPKLLTVTLKVTDLEDIISQKLYIKFTTSGIRLLDESEANDIGVLTGVHAVVRMLEEYDPQVTIDYLTSQLNKVKVSNKAPKTKEEEVRKLEGKLKRVNDLVSQYKLTDFIIKRYLLIPAGFRPENKMALEEKRKNDIDRLYIKLIDKIKKLDENSKGPKTNYFETKEVYFALKDFGIPAPNDKAPKSIIDLINGKGSDKNIFRKSLIGKRQEMSGRGVIAVNPNLKMYQVGIPESMAYGIWKLHFRAAISKEESMYEEREVIDILKNINNPLHLLQYTDDPKGLIKTFKNKMHAFLKNELCTLGRQPTLHRFNIQAFEPIMVEGDAIQIHPLICAIYNADFDGDQAWITAIQNETSKEEARAKMMVDSNIVNPKDSSMSFEHAHDIRAGVYFATMYKDNVETLPTPLVPVNIYNKLSDIELDVDLGYIKIYDIIWYNGYTTTAGRILFNALLPENGTDVTFRLYFDQIVKGGDIADIDRFVYEAYGLGIKKEISDTKGVKTVINKNARDNKIVLEFFERVMRFGFKWATLSGLSLNYSDLEQNPEIPKIIERTQERVDHINEWYLKGRLSKKRKSATVINIWKEAREEIGELIKLDRNNNLFIYTDSKARGKKEQFNQILGMIGTIRNTLDEELETPIISNYTRGLSIHEYFTLSYGTRKGQVATALETKESGDATRKMVYLTSTLRVVEDDCGCDGTTIDLEYEASGGYQNILGKKIDKKYKYYDEIKHALSEDGVAKHSILKLLEKNTKFEDILIDTNIKEHRIFHINYKLTKLHKKLLLNRYCKDFKKFLTEEDINEIEKNKRKDITIRSTLSCKSIDGVCAVCYGKKYDTNLLPEVGEDVGYSSAQAMGESSTQITLRVFHSGTGDGSVASGVKQLDNLLNLSYDRESLLAPVDGEVEVKGDTIYLNGMMIKCKNPCVVTGQFVKRGDPLETGTVNIKTLYDKTNSIEKVQMELLKQYSDVYYKSDINMNARHFEVCVRMHTQYARILDKSKSHFENQQIVKLAEVMKYNDESDDYVTYTMELLGMKKIVAHEDLLLSLSFGYIRDTIFDSIASREYKKCKSNISRCSVGEDIVTQQTLELKIPVNAIERLITTLDEKDESEEDYIPEFDDSIEDDIEEPNIPDEEPSEQIEAVVSRSTAFSK